MNKKTVGIAAATAIVVLSTLAWFWWWHAHPKHPDQLVLQGNVDLREITLAFDGSGRVEAMRVDEGQRVKAGSVLALLDTRTLRLELEQVRAAAEVQRQALERLRNGARPEDVVQARSRLAAAAAD
ncbi:biotin/lipoyl-binding protein, partial [Herbaspirillum huttiense]|uniref:biotin/lipoyl-binding protein n=1 Tax=Herbaspirillum huttiense TaxID=863372 RepID=UPI003B3BE70D